MSDALKVKGNDALKKGNFDAAISAYTDAIKIDEANIVLYSNRSAAHVKAGHYDEALVDAEKCISLDSKWPKGYSRKASALEYLKRYNDAEEAYSTALEFDPDNQQLRENLDELRKKNVLGSIIDKVAAHPRLCKKLAEPGYVEKLKLLQMNPQLLGSLMRDSDIQETMLSLFTIETDESMPSPLRQKKESIPKTDDKPTLSEEEQNALNEKELGNTAYKQKDFEKALEHYDKALELQPNNITFYTNKSAVYFEMKDYEKCISVCEKAVEIGREQRADYKLIAKAYARIGSCYEKTDDLSSAKKYFDKSLSEFRAPEIIKKAQTLNKLLTEKEKLAYIDPEKAEEDKNKGNTAFTQGDYPVALKHYSEAIRRNPADAKLYSNRAACYNKLMEFQMALADCEKCIEISPDFIKGYLRKGACLVAMKDLGAAKKAYRKALELDANCDEARDGLRQCFVSDTDPEAVRQRAMNDPEVAAILCDPAMRMILNQMEDPAALREHLNNPEIASKLMKLIDAGLISVR